MKTSLAKGLPEPDDDQALAVADNGFGFRQDQLDQWTGVQQINVSGSPFKGKADAPVAVATFNDFE